MKYKKIALFLFVDALGWRILEDNPNFLKGLLPHRKKLRTILGYSNACDPSIISGLMPSEHYHWSSFYYSPHTSPFRWTKLLSLIPSPLTNRQRVRGYLSKMIKSIHGFTGYFQIYQVPFKHLALFDYGEKERIWDERGLENGRTIFNELTDHHIPYYVGDLDLEQVQVTKAVTAIQSNQIPFAYLLFGELDAVMHAHGTKGSMVEKTLDSLERKISTVIQEAQNHYDEVDYYIFSDHGMHDVKETYDLQKDIEETGLVYGKDYVAFYDSTMARFWFLNDQAGEKIRECLKHCPKGHILSDDELKREGVYFPDYRYGEMVFLMDSGILIIPSFMGLKRIPGMHGYHPNDEDSYAMIASNASLSEDLNSIEEIYHLMKSYVAMPGRQPVGMY